MMNINFCKSSTSNGKLLILNMKQWMLTRKSLGVSCTHRNYQSAAEIAASRKASGGSTGGFDIGVLLFGSICVGACALGAWQVQRYQWKVDLIEDMTRKFSENASNEICLEHARQALTASTGSSYVVVGRYMHDREVLLGPRSGPFKMGGTAAKGMASNPQGYYVITPLLLSNTGNTDEVVFINRGWIPKKMEDGWDRPEGEVSVSCLVAKKEPKKSMSPSNHADAKSLLWLEIPSLLRNSELEQHVAEEEVVILDEVFISPSSSSSSTSPKSKSSGKISYPFPKSEDDFLEQSVPPVTHVVYAITWFSLAAAGLFMTYRRFRPPVPNRRPAVVPSVTTAHVAPTSSTKK